MAGGKKLVVHLGYHNDAQNAIQVWLKLHEAELEDQLRCFNRVDGGVHALAATASAFSRGRADRKALDAAARTMADTVRAVPQPVVCITDEDLLGRPLGFRTSGQAEASIYPRACGIADSLAAAFEEFDTTFVTIERDPDPWLRSLHNQLTDIGWENGTLADFRKAFNTRLDWEALRHEIDLCVGQRGRHVALRYASEFQSGRVDAMEFFALLGVSTASDARLRDGVGQFGPDPLEDRTTSTEATTLPGDAQRAFQIFLGRKPNPSNPQRYQSICNLHRALEKSAEFQKSTRAVKNTLAWPMRQAFVSRPARIIYCPIVGNASTFLKSEVARSAALPFCDHMARNVHFITDHVRTGAQLSDCPLEEAEHLIDDPQYLRVAVIREPMERLLSAYVENFVRSRLLPVNIRHTRSVIDTVQKGQGIATPDYERGITFRDFIDCVTGTDPSGLDPRWRPQAHFLEGIKCDRYYRIDQIDSLLALIEERSGVTLRRRPRHVDGSGPGEYRPGAQDLLPARIDTLPKLSKDSFFDHSLRARVEVAFADDYALFRQTEG